MNKTEKRVLRNVIKRLRGVRASNEVAEALQGVCRIYLETWVIPPLELLVRDDRTIADLDLADRLAD